MPAGAKPASAAKATSAARTRANAVGGIGDGVELVDGEDDVRHAQQLREQGVAARLRQQLAAASQPTRSSLVASTSTTAASLPAAAVTMLRVYCSWPGASAMMNLRSRVAK